MRVHRCGGAAEFLSATLEYRGREPLRTNVLGSVATTTAAGAVPLVETYWWVVLDGDGRVVGAAMRTEPFALSLGPMPPEAAATLAATVAALDPEIPAVMGTERDVASFLAAFGAAGARSADGAPASGQRQILYEATGVRVAPVDGALCVATSSELDHAVAWYQAFTEEVDGVRMTTSEAERAQLATTIRTGRLRWWRVDGEIVSMAAHAAPVETPSGVVTRVGPVYTPARSRGRGYAGVLTGRLTELLLARGSAVMLFADAANPTSNGVYRRLGYVAVDELVRIPLTPTAPGDAGGRR